MSSPLKVGAMFAGYSGIELGLAQVFGADAIDLAWYAEFDKHAASIMERHHPGVKNLWDVTKVDWPNVEPVDILTGGSPCQDLSHAGKRKGMTTGTRSNLWVEMREAIAVMRPRLVIWENVRGAYSAEADSALESCPRCVGDPRDRGPVLRALGRVLGDLSELGYDARWYGLRAADVGAPHGRFRVFLFATPADADLSGLGGLGWLEPVRRDADGCGRADGPRATGEPEALLTLLPTPTTSDTNGAGAHGDGGADLRTTVATLLPTPRATDGTKGGPNQRGSSGDLMLPSAVQLLPTPQADTSTTIQHGKPALQAIAIEQATQWGDYAPAIARWEHVIGRPAPEPTEPGPKGSPRLSARFVEFMMGLPAGHVTDTPGLSRNNALKALGNGVVPQQCAAALRAYLEDEYGLPTPAALLPTPAASQGDSLRSSDEFNDLGRQIALLPTPAVNDMGDGKTVEQWDEWTAKMRAKHGNGNGHGNSLAIEAQRLGSAR